MQIIKQAPTTRVVRAGELGELSSPFVADGVAEDSSVKRNSRAQTLEGHEVWRGRPRGSCGVRWDVAVKDVLGGVPSHPVYKTSHLYGMCTWCEFSEW